MPHLFLNCASSENFKDLEQNLKKMAKRAKFHSGDLATDFPITQTNVSLELADQLVTLIRTHLTNSCYDTHDTITDDEKLIGNKKPWFILDDYKDALMKLANNNFELFKELIETDISMRLKRCQGYQWIYFSCLVNSENAVVFDITIYRK